jgi:hypothetical protein
MGSFERSDQVVCKHTITNIEILRVLARVCKNFIFGNRA